MPVEAEEWESIFLVILVLPYFNFFPLWYKKTFKVEIADAYISAVGLCLPVQNKTFSILLLSSMDEKKSFACSTEEGTE